MKDQKVPDLLGNNNGRKWEVTPKRWFIFTIARWTLADDHL
jgi:hypothetical protein